MKNIYLMASVALIVTSQGALASNSNIGGQADRYRRTQQAVVQQPNVQMKVMQMQQLEGRHALSREVVEMQDPKGKQYADLASKGATVESGNVLSLHAGIPKNIQTGKAAEALVNTLKARAAIFTEIQNRVGKKAAAPAKDYEAQLAENMATLKAQQQQYLKVARESPGVLPQNLQNVTVGFQDMNDRLDKQYLDLLSSVK